MRLRRVDPNGSGYSRVRRGRGFSYHDERGRLITDRAVLSRIRTLAVPPAWRDVWICPHPHGHIQAVGIDDAGRRQYRYHEEWRRRRDAEKHDRVLRLARRLPRIRGQLAEELNQRELTYERVLAAALRMLDLGVFRVGGEEYAPTVAQDAEDLDGSYGLATVRRDHVRLDRGAVVFCYPAKGGAERYLTLHDSALYQVIRALLRRRGGGEELLAYRVGQDWRDVKAHDVNARLKQLAGEEFSAKDLRRGTRLSSRRSRSRRPMRMVCRVRNGHGPSW